MSGASASSSVRQARQALAGRLREIRVEAGLTAREVARRSGWHESKCSRLEHARTVPSAADIRAWCAACGAADQVPDLIASLHALDSMYVEWRRLLRTGLKRQQQSRLPLYERTRHFRSYASWLLPGLVQTESYTRAVLTSLVQRQRIVDDVDEAVASRMERQRVLRIGDHRFAFVIEEQALRATVCEVETMAAQLRHLVTVAGLPNVSLGVVPAGPERVRWPAENFWIFDGAQVAVELVSSYLTVTTPGEVAEYAAAFDELASMAVYGDAAGNLIAEAAGAL